ncbi:hypothetical protein [Fulvivirga sp.]|uniref:hypothetical protein n=1 Tax=Fulvivirga sp. TaxID=1931237 RepID=UPI0032EDFE8E
MILLNGLPPILGATFLHVVIINVLAIVVEYYFIKRRYYGSRLLLRVVLANLISVLIGSVIVLSVPELIGGATARPDSYEYNNYDKFAMLIGLICLFLSNVLVETPAYLFGIKISNETWNLINLILIANLITNIPVIIIYFLVIN